MDSDLVFQVKCTIFWINRDLRVHLDLYAPNFPRSTSKFLFFTKVVKKHGSRCFTEICNFWIQCFCQKLVLHNWDGFCFLNQKRLQHRVFWTKKYMDVKSTYRYFWKSTQNKSKYTLKSLLSQNMVHFT